MIYQITNACDGEMLTTKLVFPSKKTWKSCTNVKIPSFHIRIDMNTRQEKSGNGTEFWKNAENRQKKRRFDVEEQRERRNKKSVYSTKCNSRSKRWVSDVIKRKRRRHYKTNLQKET